MSIHFDKRERSLLFVCLAVVGAYLVNGLVLVPVRKEGERLDGRIQKAQRDYWAGIRIVRKGEAAGRRYDKILELYQQRESDEEVMSTILREIEDTAARNQLSISDIKPNKPKAVDYYKEFSIGLTLEGEFAEVMKFIALLQNDPYQYFVGEVDITKNASRTDTLRCRMVLSKVLIP